MDKAALQRSYGMVEPGEQLGGVRPVKLWTVGTRSSDAGVRLMEEHAKIPKLLRVPFAWTAGDTMSWEAHLNRLSQEFGHSIEYLKQVLPQSRYVRLKNPLRPGMDWNEPLNADIARLIFDKQVREMLTRPEVQGAGGVGLSGFGHAQFNLSEIDAHQRRTQIELPRANPGNLGLLQGARTFVLGTFSGATGLGGSAVIAAVVKSVDPDGQLVLRALLPDLWSSDTQARAQTAAVIRDLREWHRYGNKMELLDGRNVESPIDAFTFVGTSNGGNSINGDDALAESTQVILAHLNARMQSAINAMAADVTPPAKFDPEFYPMTARGETALNIRVAHPVRFEYAALSWTYAENEEEFRRFESVASATELSVEVSAAANVVYERVAARFPLTLKGLASEIDRSVGSGERIRRRLEEAQQRIGQGSAKEIQDFVPPAVEAVLRMINDLDRPWQEAAYQRLAHLPQEIIAYVEEQPEDRDVQLGALKLLQNQLTSLAENVRTGAEAKGREREAARQQHATDLTALRDASGFLGFIGKSGNTLAAGLQAIDSGAAVCQRKREHGLLRLLDGMLSAGLTARAGSAVVLQGLLKRMESATNSFVLRTRQSFVARRTAIETTRAVQRRQISRLSRYFNRDLVFDGLGTADLDRLIAEHRRAQVRPEAITKFLRAGEPSLDGLVKALMPHLPRYTDGQLKLTSLLLGDERLLAAVTEHLKSTRDFMRTDSLIEVQQGLKDRRDTIRILVVPDGRTSELARHMIAEGVVADEKHVIEGVDDNAIMFYYCRSGLPFEVLADLPPLDRELERYMMNPGAITPHLRPDGHLLKPIRPPRSNLKQHVETVLYTARAVLSERFQVNGLGELTMRYSHTPSGHRLSVNEDHTEPNVQALMGWLAKEPAIRHRLEDDLRTALSLEPQSYRNALVQAFRASEDVNERDRLREALYHLNVDPGAWTLLSKNGTSSAGGAALKEPPEEREA